MSAGTTCRSTGAGAVVGVGVGAGADGVVVALGVGVGVALAVEVPDRVATAVAGEEAAAEGAEDAGPTVSVC